AEISGESATASPPPRQPHADPAHEPPRLYGSLICRAPPVADNYPLAARGVRALARLLRADLPGKEREKLVAVQHKFARLGDGALPLAPQVARCHLTDPLDGVRVVQVDVHHRPGGEVRVNPGAAAVDGHRPGEEAVGELFRPVVRAAEVLDGQRI